MWVIKFLSGPKAGQEILLQKGLVLLGRNEDCQIIIPSKGISQQHAQITVNDDAIEIKDLNSSNGIFYNGKKIKTQKLKEGDRVALNDIIFEVLHKNQQQIHPYFQPYPHVQNYGQSIPNNHTQNEGEDFQNATAQNKNSNFQNIEKGIKGYLHDVVLPGVYKLAEWLEFKWVVGFLLIGFVLLVMTLSSVPLIQILKSSVEQESRNHAESIAVTLSKLNRENLKSGFHSALTVDYAQRRPGVKHAYIISALDGRILAPSELSHTYPKQSFIHKARKLDKNTIQKTGTSTVGAVVPIRFHNSETGENRPVAYSVVLYDMGSITIGNSEILSLLIQNLFIACVIGLLFFFFLINLIEFPIKSINHQLNEALKSKSSSISTSYQSSILNELCSHINSALNQISLNQILNSNEDSKESDKDIDINRQSEMNNLVEIVGFPCLSINLTDDTIASVNSNFTEQIGYNDIVNSPISNIDSDLKEHLEMLIEQGKANPEEISFGEIHIKNMTIQTTCQLIMGKKDPAYAIITFMNSEEEGAA